jgi:hypothetical protein
VVHRVPVPLCFGIFASLVPDAQFPPISRALIPRPPPPRSAQPDPPATDQAPGGDGSGGPRPEGGGAGRPRRAPRRGALRRRRPPPARRHRAPRLRQQVPARPPARSCPLLLVRYGVQIISALD